MRMFITLIMLTLISCANIQVYTSQGKKIMSISKSDLANLFLKKTDTLNGIKVTPIDNSNAKAFQEFYKIYINKTPDQLRAYWADQVLLNYKSPPKKLSDSQIIQELSSNHAIITYSSSGITGGIRVTIR